MGNVTTHLKTICGLPVLKGGVTGVLLVMLGAGGMTVYTSEYRKGWITVGVALVGLALMWKHSRNRFHLEPEIYPEEVAEPETSGWEITIRKVERDLALRQVNAVLAGRPFRGGHPRSIVTAEIADIEHYLEERIINLKGEPPTGLDNLVETIYKNSMTQKDFPERLAYGMASIVEQSLKGK